MAFNPLYLTHLINGVIMVALPVGLGFFLSRRFQIGWRVWWIGAATFVLSQVGHIPFNLIVFPVYQKYIISPLPTGWSIILISLFLGLSAGLWEELSRYTAYRWWAKDARTWSKGVMMGNGHGGAEAILLGVLVLINYFVLLALKDAELARFVAPDQLELAQQQVGAYWSAPWYLTLFGAVERMFTLPAQIALSVIVLQTFLRRQRRWLWIAVGWHAALDAFLAGIVPQLWGAYVTEALIGISALINIGIIFILRSPEPTVGLETEAPALTVTPFTPMEVPVTPEKLDDTRYN